MSKNSTKNILGSLMPAGSVSKADLPDDMEKNDVTDHKTLVARPKSSLSQEMEKLLQECLTKKGDPTLTPNS